MTDDQRFASRRPDVIVFQTDILDEDLTLGGPLYADLFASLSTTDADFVVKLIDVYPDEVAMQPAMGGYQLMVSADIFRGRYRESFETAKTIACPSHVSPQIADITKSSFRRSRRW